MAVAKDDDVSSMEETSMLLWLLLYELLFPLTNSRSGGAVAASTAIERRPFIDIFIILLFSVVGGIVLFINVI